MVSFLQTKVEGRVTVMEQLYDRALKALMEDHAAEMLPELLPGAELVSVENIELNRPNLRADLVYFIRYQGEPRILNVELQTDDDSDMNYRMLQYHIELYGRYRMPIISMVVYPFEKNIREPVFQEESGTGTSLFFRHQTLQLCLVEAEQCLRKGVISMYTLLPAMKGVTVAMLLQAITEIEKRYPQPHLTRHLLRFRTILRRSITLSHQDKQIVEGKLKSYDSLLAGDSELQKEIQEVIQERVQREVQEVQERVQREVQERVQREVQERVQREVQERVQREVQERVQREVQERVQREVQERIEERQQAVLDVVEVRFPALLEMAREQVAHLDDRNELRRLAKQIILAPDEMTARWALSTFAA